MGFTEAEAECFRVAVKELTELAEAVADDTEQESFPPFVEAVVDMNTGIVTAKPSETARQTISSPPPLRPT